MAVGMTTVVAQSSITEAIQSATERAADNRQQATTAVVQQKAEKNVKSVQHVDNAENIQKVRRKEEEDEEQKRREQKKKKNRPTGRNLDLKA